MATTEEKIKQQFKQLQKTNAVVFSCKVLSIDKDEKTIKVEDSFGIEYPDVRLKSSISDTDAVIKYPLKDSYVLVAMIGNQENDLLVIAFDDVEEIEGVIGDISFKVNKDEILLNGDGNKGLVKIEDLVSKLNDLENGVNQLKNEFNSHTHNAPQAPTGTIPTAPPLVPSTLNMQNTVVNDLENKKVKHGE